MGTEDKDIDNQVPSDSGENSETEAEYEEQEAEKNSVESITPRERRYNGNDKVDHDQITELLKAKAGNITAVCQALNINRTTFYRWLEKDKELKRIVDEQQESLIDFAESRLFQNIKDGDTTSIIFYLKTKGRNRGYVEQTDLRVHQEIVQITTVLSSDETTIIDLKPNEQEDSSGKI
jgi:hypothetical protein